MINFAEILSNYYVKNLGIPILSLVMTTVFKIISRKDHSLKVTRNDAAIGINLIVTGLILILNYAIKLSEKSKNLTEAPLQMENTSNLMNMLILALLYCLACFLVSALIRLYGWRKEDEKELNMFMGIIVPIVFGGFLLVVAANYSNR